MEIFLLQLEKADYWPHNYVFDNLKQSLDDVKHEVTPSIENPEINPALPQEEEDSSVEDSDSNLDRPETPSEDGKGGKPVLEKSLEVSPFSFVHVSFVGQYQLNPVWTYRRKLRRIYPKICRTESSWYTAI